MVRLGGLAQKPAQRYLTHFVPDDIGPVRYRLPDQPNRTGCAASWSTVLAPPIGPRPPAAGGCLICEPSGTMSTRAAPLRAAPECVQTARSAYISIAS
jgi:hypothetical protein